MKKQISATDISQNVTVMAELGKLNSQLIVRLPAWWFFETMVHNDEFFRAYYMVTKTENRREAYEIAKAADRFKALQVEISLAQMGYTLSGVNFNEKEGSWEIWVSK